ncbi:hypothetical protein B7463_g3489, partial [Scytalidium lignicola]
MILLESVFNHLVLPPKVPGQADEDTEGIKRNILDRLIQACNTISKYSDEEFERIWASIRSSLRICSELNGDHLEKELLIGEFRNLQPNDQLILHVVEQNAALLIRRHVSSDTVVFEAFESSPSSETVLAADNTLEWDFPGCAVEIEWDEFLQTSFQENIAFFLEKASIEPLHRFSAHRTKASASVVEARGTTDPAVITQMLMPLLEAIGCPIKVPRLRKRVQDDVNIQNAELPWRRLPFWLILRVAIQRHLYFSLGNEKGRACYKFLICTMLALFLKECVSQLAPELTVMLKAKLCRRLAKLELDKAHAGSDIYQHLFSSIGPFLREIIENSAYQIELSWDHFKRANMRHIPKLPRRADNQAFYLSLPNSGIYLSNLLKSPYEQPRRLVNLPMPSLSGGTTQKVRTFTEKYFRLVELDDKIETEWSSSTSNLVPDCQTQCLKMAGLINDLFTVVSDACNSNPEQMSIFILNLFTRWVEMDKFAVRSCEVLRYYRPVFDPELLDVLQLPTLSMMRRLQYIQQHLQRRRQDCRFTHLTILSEPGNDCFAVEYVKQSTRLEKLYHKIRKASERSRLNKTFEWESACKEYDNLTAKFSKATCSCSFNLDGSRNVSGCKKCWHGRCRRRIKIAIHEDFLPTENGQRASVLFELGIPEYLEAYRNATWKIVSTLGHPSRPNITPSPVMLLKDYSQLQNFTKRSVDGIQLASTKKSFLQTHFKEYKMKVALDSILLPFGLEFSYFDMQSDVWLKDLNRPLTFQHLCGIHIPRSLQASVIQQVEHPATTTDGPSSYQIIASQAQCPSDISVHEFISYQKLLSGKSRRWINILVELGASNLNFSSEDTMHIISQLAVQAGPTETEVYVLRDIHVVFQDELFCDRLLEQIGNWINKISSNWRERYCMDMLITLCLRVFELAPYIWRESAKMLLKNAREATLQWISHLRDEVRNATEADAAERAAIYGFWAALLCRRTFATFIGSHYTMNEEDLCSFVKASVALQENLVVDLSKLPQVLRNMLARDIKMVYHIQSTIQKSIQSNPNSLGAAINEIWSGNAANSTQRTYSPWEFIPSAETRWVTSRITSRVNKFITSQIIHYNFLEGHLFVDGKPIGRLPPDIRDLEDVKELFGNQHLLTFPSPLTGMSHVLATNMQGHEVHFGVRGETVAIIALTMDGPLEYVPRRVFGEGDNIDLPLGLIENCVHWLNLHTGRLYIRRKPSIWKTRPSDWSVDVPNHRAQRKQVFLVNPHSSLCKQVAGIFHHFEDPRRLTVFQPAKGWLSVELRHLDLSFFVNQKNLLQCRELRSEIDPNQDAGTLYGFESKIVLREVPNIERRSLIASLGNLTFKRHGMHVVVRAQSSDQYGRFEIDDVLGQLSCPPEPRLLYSKAQFHAFTSFVLPDPLTGRTGTEEALQILQSGYCQPWMPIADNPSSILKSIQSLSPQREYYPKDKMHLQTVSWNEHLTMSIQHESYDTVIQEILDKSDRLRVFTSQYERKVDFNMKAPSHLRRRAQIRKALYERDSSLIKLLVARQIVYNSRDRQVTLPQATNVFQIVKLVHEQPFKINMNKKLATILQSWKLIGGFHDKLDWHLSSLNDLFENNIAEQWGSLVNLCRQTDPQDQYKLIFQLSFLAFGIKPDMDTIKALTAFACLEELKTLQPPSCSSFSEFRSHASPTLLSIQNIITPEQGTYSPAPKAKKSRGSAQEEEGIRNEAEYKRLACFLLTQWPSSEPSIEGFESTVINVTRIYKTVLPEWERLHRNWELSEYVVQVQEIIRRYKGSKTATKLEVRNESAGFSYFSLCSSVIPSLRKDLLIKPGAIPSDDQLYGNKWLSNRTISQDERSLNYRDNNANRRTSSREMVELEKILFLYSKSGDELRQQYGNDLMHSLEALRNVSNQTKFQDRPPHIDLLNDSIKKVRIEVQEQLYFIKNAFSSEEDRYLWLELGNLWPSTTPRAILEQLRSSVSNKFGSYMKEALVRYGILLTTIQRLLRLKHAQLKEDYAKLKEEWQNPGHENWNPLDFPDWLLLEIECGILIRPEQVDVAHAIISPASRSNSVLQMNMGKGKSSCIMPMATAVLADKKQLSRLIVPKPLLLQTAQTLQSRLGGLIGREIRHIPFSRRTPSTKETLALYSQLHHEILNSAGIILTIPEHILSYKLSGLQRLADYQLDQAQKMIEFQSWLTEISRDILDESDFTLAAKTQLIYPNGPQLPVDGHPYRWEVAQMLLSLVEDHLPDLQRNFSRSIEVIQRPEGFPILHFLQTDVEDALHSRIISDICDGRALFLRLLDSPSPATRVKIRRILLEGNISQDGLKEASRLFANKDSAHKNLLLIRGLLINRILLLCLKKRWNVQYGLHPRRDPIAVPFEAKGVPSEQSEFGHPDVSIVFTCLAFYYTGLNIAQLRQGLHHVLKSDDPAAEYDRWRHGSDTLPETLHHWSGINTDDQGQVHQLWRHLRLNRNVLDHYMNKFVFPVHAKQFGVKLQASGWDIPLFSQPVSTEKTSRIRTTGFSGTNDNKMMLPLTIKQDDLPTLQQTNAEVLTYLLQDRNRKYNLAASQGKRLSEEQLLKKINANEIRVLIDAGAYILEMDNVSLVKAWLDIDIQAKGAVYFGVDNRAWVQYRGGKAAVPLLATPFAENLDECLVYLDEAHTRGIDLKLPQKAKGALTLALGQTKDHTVQAAMRLRLLGITQSITFFAPPEVHQSIIDVCKLRYRDVVNSSHVITWLLEQTCNSIEHTQKLYLAQRADFCRRTNSQWENYKFLTDPNHREIYLKVIQHPERQSLEELYGCIVDSQSIFSQELLFPQMREFMDKLRKQALRALSKNKYDIPSGALEEVEQERQIEFQVEEVRQVQKPTRYKPLTFPGLNRAVSHFVDTGHFTGKDGYKHAFEALAHTNIGQKYDIQWTSSRLFVSVEVMRTIEVEKKISNDNFLRPIEWILWNPSNQTALIIIPEEAELLIPTLRQKKNPKVHLLAYAAPVTKNMLQFGKLSYYALPCLPFGHAVPNWLSIELGIFAGRLYFDFSECDALCKYLRLSNISEMSKLNNDNQVELFTEKPISFLLEWLALRRKGQDIMHTPMGYICQGRPLHKNHSFFIKHVIDIVAPVHYGASVDSEVEDEADIDIEEVEWDEDFETS